MRKRFLWIAAALALIAIPAVIGLVALRDDDSSSSARRAAALVAAGSATEYQLQLVPQGAMVAPHPGKEAIEVESFSFGAENPTTIGSATGGAGAGKIKFNEFRVTKRVDKASPALFKNMAAGAHYAKATLTLRKPAAKEPYMTYSMETVFTTKIDHGGGSPEVATEEITFVFGKLVIQSTDRNADGTLSPPVQYGWNQVTNVSDDQIKP
jgi:type VI secretion system secreted protein Hcp